LGIMKRFEKDESIIKILILMNKPNSKDFAKELVFKEMLKNTNNDFDHCKGILSSVEFIPSVIDRIVTKLHEEIIKTQIIHELLKLLSKKANLKNQRNAKA